MSDVIDLSKMKKTTENIINGAGGKPQPPSEKQPVLSAILLFLREDGTWVASYDLSVVDKLDVIGEPDGNKLIAGLSVLLSDVQSEKTANMNVMMMQQLAAQQMQQMQGQQLAQKLQQQGLRTT